MQYALARVTINCIRLRQKPKIYPISRLLQQNIHLSEVNLILGLLPSLELPCCYAATSSCAVLQTLVTTVLVTFDLSTSTVFARGSGVWLQIQ